jgi:hypothetical protein
MMVELRRLGVIEPNHRVVEFQFKDISIFTTGKHATSFLQTHCDNYIDYKFSIVNDFSSISKFYEMLSNNDERKHIFLVREPLQRFLSGLASDWKCYVRGTLKIFNVPTTAQNVLKSIDKDFLDNLITNENLLINAHHCGNWLKFVLQMKLTDSVSKLTFVKYEDRKKLFLKLGLKDMPIINETKSNYKILYEDLSSESKGIIDTYLREEIRYYNYIFEER